MVIKGDDCSGDKLGTGGKNFNKIRLRKSGLKFYMNSTMKWNTDLGFYLYCNFIQVIMDCLISNPLSLTTSNNIDYV